MFFGLHTLMGLQLLNTWIYSWVMGSLISKVYRGENIAFTSYKGPDCGKLEFIKIVWLKGRYINFVSLF